MAFVLKKKKVVKGKHAVMAAKMLKTGKNKKVVAKVNISKFTPPGYSDSDSDYGDDD